MQLWLAMAPRFERINDARAPYATAGSALPGTGFLLRRFGGFASESAAIFEAVTRRSRNFGGAGVILLIC